MALDEMEKLFRMARRASADSDPGIEVRGLSAKASAGLAIVLYGRGREDELPGRCDRVVLAERR